MVEDHAGHRGRMYEKVENGTQLLDRELMEIALFSCLPRRNTADLAHKLEEAFGSAAGALYAPLAELKEVVGVGGRVAYHIYVMGLLFRNTYQKRVYDPFAGVFHLREFALRGVELYAEEDNEVLDIYLLDEDNRVVSRHRRTDVNKRAVGVDTQWLGNLLLDERVCGVVMAHNHPDGRARYSTDDELATRACQMVCNMHGKMLCDHVIFSNEGSYSYYKEGELEKISEKYAVDTMLKEKVYEERVDKAVALRKEAEEEYAKEKKRSDKKAGEGQA